MITSLVPLFMIAAYGYALYRWGLYTGQRQRPIARKEKRMTGSVSQKTETPQSQKPQTPAAAATAGTANW
jgi:hypothetical protein